MIKPIVLGIDFDGVCCKHEYPKIGADIGAAPVLRELAEQGHVLILNTMRSGKELAEAAKWFQQNGIPLAGLNTNPWQSTWTSSPKVYAQLYIDDAALGAPVKYDDPNSRGYINWDIVRNWLVSSGLLPKAEVRSDIVAITDEEAAKITPKLELIKGGGNDQPSKPTLELVGK